MDKKINFENVKKLVVRKVGTTYQLTEIGMKFFVELVLQEVKNEIDKKNNGS